MHKAFFGTFVILLFAAACLVKAPPRVALPLAAASGSKSAAGAQAPVDAGAAEVRPITLSIGGDVTLGFHYEEYFDEQLAKGKTRDQMFEYGFREVHTATDGADLFVVNLECPFTDRGEKISKNFNFRGRPELVAALLAGGVGAVSLANNHMMDYGSVGLMDTLATLDQAGVPHFGAGPNLAEARKPAIVERNGVKIAFLGYFFLGDHNIEPTEVIATDNTPGVAGHHDDVAIMAKMLEEDIARARSEADLVIPFFHWGKENEHVPQPYQIRLAHLAIDSGAAAVLGSHPHVLQGMELYKGAPVFYSMGNFVFGGNWNPRDKESAIVRARFSSGGFLSSDLFPIQTDHFPEVPVQPFMLVGEPRTQVLRHLAEYSAGFQHVLPALAPYRPKLKI